MQVLKTSSLEVDRIREHQKRKSQRHHQTKSPHQAVVEDHQGVVEVVETGSILIGGRI
jgi:hypothetical protein